MGDSVDLGTAYGRIVLDATGVDAAMGQVQRSIADGLERAGSALSGIGGALTAATAPLLLMGRRGVQVAGEFESAMLEVQARTGATAAVRTSRHRRGIRRRASNTMRAATLRGLT